MKMAQMFSELLPTDMQTLLYPKHRMREYQVIEKSKLIPPLMMAWEKGLYTYLEVRGRTGEIRG